MDRMALLKKVNLFSNLSEAHLSSIAEFCVERSFREGEVIIKQGNSGIGLDVICSGKVKIVKETAVGEKMDIAELGPEDFFGEMAVLDRAMPFYCQKSSIPILPEHQEANRYLCWYPRLVSIGTKAATRLFSHLIVDRKNKEEIIETP